MKSRVMNRILIVISCAISGLLFFIINSTAIEIQPNPIERIAPSVDVKEVWQSKHQTVLTGHGLIEPLESAQLVTEVSGKVTYWSPHLVPGGIVKRETLLMSIEKDAYQAAVLEAEQNVAAAKAQLVEEQARADVAGREAKGFSKGDVSDLYLRRPQLHQAKVALDSALASLKLAEKELHNCDIYAPFDGLVVAREVGHRQYVNQGQQVAMLHNIEFAEVSVPIAGFERAFLPDRVSQIEALVSSDYQESRKGKVVRDLGVIDSQTRMRRVAIRIEDPYSLSTKQPVLRFGEFVETKFPGKLIENVYQVPQGSVSNNELWVVDEDNRLQPKPVSVISAQGNQYIVKGNLGTSAVVVLTVPEYPRAGMIVNPHDRQSSTL